MSLTLQRTGARRPAVLARSLAIAAATLAVAVGLAGPASATPTAWTSGTFDPLEISLSGSALVLDSDAHSPIVWGDDDTFKVVADVNDVAVINTSSPLTFHVVTELDGTAYTASTVRLRLVDDHSAPGDFTLSTSGDSLDNSGLPDEVTLNADAHASSTWTFEGLGTYELEFRAVSDQGGISNSATHTVTVEVVAP